MAKPLQDITVLVADDAPLNLMIMTQVLTEAGAKVITAANGRQALEKLEEHDADIVLMDLQMPELDGFQATEVIRYSGQRYSKIPIIAVTAETASSEIEKSINAGMNDFISKPFVPQVIQQKILALLQANQPEPQPVASEQKPESAPAFDLSYLKEITNGETDKLMMIVNNLMENAPLLLQNAQQAAWLEKWPEAAADIHKLKGLVGLFFMPEITEALQIAETGAKSEQAESFRVNDKIAFVSDKLPALLKLIINDLKK